MMEVTPCDVTKGTEGSPSARCLLVVSAELQIKWQEAQVNLGAKYAVSWKFVVSSE